MRILLFLFVAFVGLFQGISEPIYSHLGIPTSALHRAEVRLETLDSVFAEEFGKGNPLIKIAKSIVFPEVIRYEQSIDLVQAGLNKVKVNGSPVFDFSIGPFQIKPKFIERLRIAGSVIGMNGVEALPYDLGQIVEMLETEKGSIHIIRLVIELVLSKNPELMNLNPDKVVRLLSTAYTFGFFENLDELDRASRIPTWHCLGMVRNQRIPYSDVAILYLSTSGT